MSGESTQPAVEHHVGTLDLSGEGNRAEVASPISDAMVEAMAQRIHTFAYPGAPWDLLTEESRDWCRQNARAALEAAYPAIREQVAEEIAVALEAEASRHTVPTASLTLDGVAATIARQIGRRGGIATAPGQAVGADLTAGANADPSDPPESQALSKRLPGVEG